MSTAEAITTEQVIGTLRAHEPALRAAGIRALSLFGSVARGEARPDSDIDLVAAFDPAAKMDLIRLVGLERELSDLLGREVQILPAPINKPRLRAEVERDRVRAFQAAASPGGFPGQQFLFCGTGGDPAPVCQNENCCSLEDIVDTITRIERYDAGLQADDLAQDGLRYDAVERCLERICEAAFRLGDAASELMPDQPWLDIRGMGNRLRHAYDRVDLAIVWHVVSNRLPELRADATAAMAKLQIDRTD